MTLERAIELVRGERKVRLASADEWARVDVGISQTVLERADALGMLIALAEERVKEEAAKLSP